MSLKNLYILTSFQLTASALFIIAVSSLIVYDQEDVINTATDIKESLKVEVVQDSFKDYYSVFNKKGGWLNLAFVIMGLGFGAFVISMFGYFGVHSKTVVLLFTFIFLHLTILMLQIGTLMLLKWRKQELLQFYFFSNFGETVTDFHHDVKQMMFVLSVMWTVVSLVTCLVTLVIRSKTKRKEKQFNVSSQPEDV